MSYHPSQFSTNAITKYQEARELALLMDIQRQRRKLVFVLYWSLYTLILSLHYLHHIRGYRKL